MLKRLYIENYALIEHLDINFHEGFSVITGETGAGKSILMDALDLVLGKRADTQVLLDPQKKCVVEGAFEISRYPVQVFFTENSLDYENVTILRREINPAGKSRAFINDTPVNLSQLKSLGDKLIDIHAQHATTSLQDPDFQLSVVDNFAGLHDRINDYRERYFQWLQEKRLLAELLESERSGRASFDYRKFLFDELEAARLQEEEQQLLEDELSLIVHAEVIKTNLGQALNLLAGEEGGILDLLTEAESLLKKVSSYHTGLEALSGRMQSGLVDLKDINGELSRLDESIEFDQERMVEVQQRLDLINRLLHKHQVMTVKELIHIWEQLSEELEGYSSLEEKIAEMEKRVSAGENEVKTHASELSDLRRRSFSSLEKQIIERLVHMGMPDCRFEIRQQNLPVPGPDGADRLEFYFNANKGHSLKPLADIASGGELSRVMLSIKSIISQKKSLPTIIFDEIDNGLSGDIAGRVGDVLASTSIGMQVIAITHLPQIAGRADQQYNVYKDSSDKKTYSRIKMLDEQERVTELARMIGGQDTTPASLATAKELLRPATGSLTKNIIN